MLSSEKISKDLFKKKNKEEKQRSSSFVHLGHKNWNMVVNMMIGVQLAVKS